MVFGLFNLLYVLLAINVVCPATFTVLVLKIKRVITTKN